MARPVSVLLVHGINVSSQDWADPLIGRIKDRLPRDLAAITHCEAAFWANICRPHQKNFLQRAQYAGDIRLNNSRRFALEGLGDAAAYQKTPRRFEAPYYLIQKRVREALDRLDAKDDPNRPLIVIGHSLGCHILSSFIWDVNNIKQLSASDIQQQDPLVEKFHDVLRSGSPFRRLDTLAGFVTMGSNMPLFTFTFERHDVTPITRARPGKAAAFPGAALTDAQKARARWLNYFSRNDLLAYPWRPLYNMKAEETALQDIHVCSEGWLKSSPLFSPFNAIAAHTRYDRNAKVLQGTADLIRSIIEA